MSNKNVQKTRNQRALDALAATQKRNDDILRREKLYDSQENAFTGDGNTENLSPDRAYKEARRNFLGRKGPIGQAREAQLAEVKDVITLANDINYERDKDISISGDDGTAIPEALTVADAQRRSTEKQNRADASYYGNTGEVSDNSIGVGQDDQAQPLAIAGDTTVNDPSGLTGADSAAGKLVETAVIEEAAKAPPSDANTLFGNQLYDKWLAETAKQKEGLTEQKAELGREKWMQVAKLGFSILSQPGGQTFLQTIGSGAVKSGFVDGLSKLTAEQRKLTNKIGSLNKEDLKVAFGLSDKQSLYAIEGRKIDNDLQKALLISGAKGPAAVKKARSAYAKHQDQNYNNKSGVQHFNSLFTQATKIDSLPQGLRAEAEKNGWDGWWKENYLERASVKEAFRVNIYKAREAGISESEVFKVATIKAFNAAKKDKMREGN